MNKWNMVIDVAKCHNCANCFIACKDEYVGNDYPGYSAPQPLHGHEWIKIEQREHGSFPVAETIYVPTMCNHCDEAPCIKAGGDAISKRSDGIVIIDPVKAKGRCDIVSSCPYGAIWWNEDEDLPQAWTFDAHLLDRGWKEPRCVQVCPTGAIQTMKVSDAEMARLIDEEELEPLSPDLDTKPRIHYKNLSRYNSCFVAGTVIAAIDGIEDCLNNASIELRQNGTTVNQTNSDPFGDFRFDELALDSGNYELLITADGYKPERATLVLGESQYMGVTIMQVSK